MMQPNLLPSTVYFTLKFSSSLLTANELHVFDIGRYNR